MGQSQSYSIAASSSKVAEANCWDRGRAGSPTDVFDLFGVLDPPAMGAKREQIALIW